MPLFNELATLTHKSYIEITVTNNDQNDYTNAPVFADIPTSLVRILGCSLSEMKLVDENGNPITFWPDANGAGEIYPGYQSIWFRIDLPASGTRTLNLVCDPQNPSATTNPTDVVDIYYDFSQIPQGSDTDGDVRIDSSLYLDPPASLYLPNVNNVDSSQYNILRFPITVYDRFIAKINIMLSDQAAGGLLTGWTGSSLANPLIWIGYTSYSGCGTNIGYYNGSYQVLGQVPTDGKWHRYLVYARNDQANFDLYLDNQLLGSSLQYASSLATLTSGQTQYLEEFETVATCNPNRHDDSFVYVQASYDTLPTVSVNPIIGIDDSCITRSLSTF